MMYGIVWSEVNALYTETHPGVSGSKRGEGPPTHGPQASSSASLLLFCNLTHTALRVTYMYMVIDPFARIQMLEGELREARTELLAMRVQRDAIRIRAAFFRDRAQDAYNGYMLWAERPEPDWEFPWEVK